MFFIPELYAMGLQEGQSVKPSVRALGHDKLPDRYQEEASQKQDPV